MDPEIADISIAGPDFMQCYHFLKRLIRCVEFRKDSIMPNIESPALNGPAWIKIEYLDGTSDDFAVEDFCHTPGALVVNKVGIIGGESYPWTRIKKVSHKYRDPYKENPKREVDK